MVSAVKFGVGRGTDFHRGSSMTAPGLVLMSLAVIWLSDAWIYPQDSQVAADVSRAFSSILRLVFGFFAVGLLLIDGGKSLKNFCGRNRLFLALIFFCTSSAMYFGIVGAFGFLFNLIIVAFTASYLRSHYSYAPISSALFYVLGAIMVVSFVFIVLMPSWGLMAGLHEGAFRGAFAHKNNLGLFILCFMALLMSYFRSIRAPFYMKVGMICLAGFMLIGTRSATSILLFILFVAVVMVLKFIQSSTKSTWLRCALIIMTVVSAMLLTGILVPVVLELVGRDATLTGRSSIWAFFMSRVSEAPLLGHGAFALYSDDDLVRIAGQVLFYGARSSHNAYVDILYNLGFLGLSLYIAFALGLMFSAIGSFLKSNAGDVQFDIPFITVFFAYGFVESYQSGLNAGLPLLLIMTLARRLPVRSPSLPRLQGYRVAGSMRWWGPKKSFLSA